ncbi:MAG: alcohol dehydrogenase catalytic domain-containing protein [Solirubrobacterales bacterium]|nr:alcohol dehydrogenase catalytic domain-containing protein [Solirubrobacterales bacterium]
MRAVLMRAFGDADVLELDEVPDPEPAAGEALVRVQAVEVSRTRDVATRSGQHPFSRQVTLPHVLGGDFAGVVQATGAGVDRALVGRRVAGSNSSSCGACQACRAGHEEQCPQLSMLGIHRWGSYAELVAVPAANLTEVPDGVSVSAAAAMAATGPIALTQLNLGAVSRGIWTLVTGVRGSLGTMLAVLGASLGARLIGLSRRPAEIPAELNLEARCNSSDEGLTASLLELTSDAGVEVAVDNVAAGEVFTRYFPALATGGRVVVSGAIGGPELPVLPVPAAPFYVRSLSLLGVRTTTPRDIDQFWILVRGGLRLPAGLVHELPLERAASAHARISAGDAVGHTVLTISA